MKRIVMVIALCLLPLLAGADKVVLKDGRVFEGQIVSETEQAVKLKTSKATLTFTRDQIASVEKGDSPLQERDRRLEALNPDEPEGYLDLATWLAGAGKEVADPALMKKVCNVASYLDQTQAGKAQATLGEYLLSKGLRDDATRAFARAIAADPENEIAKKNIGTLNDAVVEMNKRQLKELRDALDLAVKGNLKDAIPKLRLAKNNYLADHCQQFLKMTITDFTDDLQRRVACEACKGAAKRKCPDCGGSGMQTCQDCKGTGFRPSAKKTSFAEEACPHCFHVGTIVCPTCEAQRNYRVYTNVEIAGKNYTEVLLIGGRAREIMGKEVHLGAWYRRMDHAKITSIEADPLPRVGGTVVCKVCRGIPFDPPPTSLDNFAILRFLDEVDLHIKGDKPIEGLGKEATLFDPALVEDQKFRCKGGKWTE